jgi:T5SS/PEP-CTERM-associated repeat protein
MRRALRLAPLAVALCATLALAARIEDGQVFIFPQAPWANLTIVGLTGEGSLTIDGGTQEEADSVALGALGAGDGTLIVTGAGSRLTTTGDPTSHASVVGVANAGEGHVTISDGAVVDIDGTASLEGDPLAAGFAMAVEATSLVTGSISGTDTQLLVRNGAASGSGVAVGLGGEASLLVSDGALVQVNTGTGEFSGTTVGNDAGAVGTLTVTGDGSLYELLGEGRGLTVGNAGRGELVIDDGAVFRGPQVAFLGLEAGGEGTVRVGTGAQLRVEGVNPQLGFGGSFSVGLAGTGALLLDGGGLVIDNQDGIVHGIQAGGASGCGGPCPQTGGSGEVALEGGAEVDILGPLGGASIGADGTGSLRIAEGSTFIVSDQVNGGVSVGVSPGSSGEVVVTGEGSRLDAGGGLLLGVDFSLADAGSARLEVSDGGTARAGDVTIGSGAVVIGDGTLTALHGSVNGSIVSRGSWQPGAPIGRLDVIGDLFQTGGALHFEIAGTGDGEWDRMGVNGSAELPAAGFRVDFVDGFLPAAGDELALVLSSLVTLDTSGEPSYAGAAPGFDFEVVAEGSTVLFRALTSAEGFGACQVSQLKAFSKLCKKLFDCEAGYAKKPAKDPGGTKRDACRGKGEAGFAKTYDKAAAKALAKGEICGLTVPASEASAAVSEPADEIVGEILTEWDPGVNPDDDALRSALLKETGRLCGAFLSAASAHAKKRDEAKRESARGKARTGFDTKTAKAFQKADQAGVVYAGPDGAEIGDDTLDLARDATSRSAGVEL